MAVYLIQAVPFGHTKIGVATDPLARARQLQTSIPKKLRIVRVLEGGAEDEKALHRRFADQRVAGEWFNLSYDQITGDLGLTDLPIPAGKRAGTLHDPRTPDGRWRLLILDMYEAVGGENAFARSLGIPPWQVGDWWFDQGDLLPAMVALARQAGMTLSLPQIREFHRLGSADFVESQRKHKAAEERREERRWVAEHGAAAAWWPLSEDRAPSCTHETATETEAA